MDAKRIKNLDKHMHRYNLDPWYRNNATLIGRPYNSLECFAFYPHYYRQIYDDKDPKAMEAPTPAARQAWGRA